MVTMKYRNFGGLGFEVSALGFGAMRMPVLNNDTAQIDESEATKMIRYAIDHGVNYVDTAYNYHGGNSERVVGRALQDGYRQRVKIATKLPLPFLKVKDDLERVFNEQLEKLQVDIIDCYLLHGVSSSRWQTVLDLDVLEWVARLKQDGRVGNIGFSFHDGVDMFKKVIDYFPGWDFCQIQYNFLDIKHQAGTEGLRYAAERGLGVVVMEPLRGGSLAGQPPKAVEDVWHRSPVKRSAAGWALQWVWNQPEVSTVLSGMTTMEQVVENCAAADVSGVGSLSEAELEIVDRARGAYKSLQPVACTTCGYCMPCPTGVDIPGNLSMLNASVMFNNRTRYARNYSRMEAKKRASACIECGQCEEKCPQHLEIRRHLKEVHQALKE
jgi:uncharacterized protein